MLILKGASDRLICQGCDSMDIKLKFDGIDKIIADLDIKEDDIIPPVKDNLFALSEDQIEQKGIEHLPETLHSAVKAFKKSSLMQEVMGDHLFHKYILHLYHKLNH